MSSKQYIYIYNLHHLILFYFFFNDTATTEIYTLSLHDALPISHAKCTAGYRATKACKSWGEFAMTPSARRKARPSRRRDRASKVRLPTMRCRRHVGGQGPDHGSRKSTSQRTRLPTVARPAARWAVCGGPLLTTA